MAEKVKHLDRYPWNVNVTSVNIAQRQIYTVFESTPAVVKVRTITVEDDNTAHSVYRPEIHAKPRWSGTVGH